MKGIKKPDTDAKLKAETEKWLAKLEENMASTRLIKGTLESKVIGNAMENVNAYIADCHHFLDQKDYFNAFEAVIYAYGIYETLERMNLLEKK